MLNVYEPLLASEKRFLSSRELGRLLNIKPTNRKVTLSRLTKQKVLRRLRRDLYEIALKPSDILEAANSIYQPSYISFTYGLGKLGILNQIAYEIEFATPRRTKRLKMNDRSVVFRQIKKELFSGYTLKDGVFIADPAKALLDTLYLKNKGLTDLSIEELNLKGINKTKFLEMSKKFPLNVQQDALKLSKNMAKHA
jgi:predicted transcriptional regulator of viral defense system